MEITVDLTIVFQFLILLAFVIVICWAVRSLAQYLPGPLPVIIQVFVVLIACVVLLNMVGGFEGGHMGRIHGPCG